MHPAFSIIYFTVISGVGYGMSFVFGIGLIDLTSMSGRIGYGFALCLIGTGLLSSTLHLGHPERSIRALTQWRSSWLSREGVMAIITLIPLAFSGFAIVILGELWPLAALAGGLLSVPVVICTAMIYASLRTIHHWFSGWTVGCYLLFALSGGLLAAYCAAAFGADAIDYLPAFTIAAPVFAWICKFVWWRRADDTRSASDVNSATGLGQFGELRLLERPHINENYLTKEMGHKLARKHSAALRCLSVLTGLVLPLLAIVILQFIGSSGGIVQVSSSMLAGFLTVLASMSFLIGLFLERWLFFAEAKHTVMLYYGDNSA